jgi:hypothetical protein
MNKNIFIIKVGTTFPDTMREFGNFDLWTLRALGEGHCEVSEQWK